MSCASGVRIVLALAALALTGSIAALPARAEIVKLTILHTNDFHGRMDRAESVIETLRRLRESHPDALLLDAGDTFESKVPGAVASGGKDVVAFLNRAGYDGYTPGDNEFVEFRLADVLANLQAFQFPTISSNLRVNGAPLGLPFVVYWRNGASVAVIGVYGDRKKLARFGVEELGSKESLRRYVEQLKGKVDLIVVLSHAGAERERAYAQAVPGIDVIIGGSSHAALPPEVVNGTLIVRAQAYGAAVGVSELEIDTTQKKLHAWRFERVPTQAPAPAPGSGPAR